jgi:hypothetical protein
VLEQGPWLHELDFPLDIYYPAVHLLGTCRMGNDPARSVVDRSHRAHDVPNLFLLGRSRFVTGGRGQPPCTIQALAYRRRGDYPAGPGGCVRVVRTAEARRGDCPTGERSTRRRFQGNPREAEIVRVSYHPGPGPFIPEGWLASVLGRPEEYHRRFLRSTGELPPALRFPA